jgi:hypothetical protein
VSQPLGGEFNERPVAHEQLTPAEPADHKSGAVSQHAAQEGGHEHVLQRKIAPCRQQRRRYDSALARKRDAKGFQINHHEQRHGSIKDDQMFDVGGCVLKEFHWDRAMI